LGVAAIALMLAVRPARAGDADASVARQWLDLTLESIRADFGRPTIQARNLFHISVAMWDAWATFDERAQPWLFGERHSATDIAAARDVAISHAAYRVMLNRFSSAPGFAGVQPRYVALM
jgi:glutathione S-transferase